VTAPAQRVAALALSQAYRVASWVRRDASSSAAARQESRALQLFGGGALRPRFASVHELINQGEHLLERQFGLVPLGQPGGTIPRDIIVVDNFYEDPDAVRHHALGLEYEPYVPGWYSSALEIRDNPLKGRGVRLAHTAIRERLSAIVKDEADEATWATSGDGWNGAFHYKIGRGLRCRLAPMLGSTIHNHVGRDEDVRPGGWSGLVYLNPKPPGSAGTTIWRHCGTGRCWTLDSKYSRTWDDFEPVLEVENRYNRLILFYASIYHLAAGGWGADRNDARLFQTFFWNVRRNGQVDTWRDRAGRSGVEPFWRKLCCSQVLRIAVAPDAVLCADGSNFLVAVVKALGLEHQAVDGDIPLALRSGVAGRRAGAP